MRDESGFNLRTAFTGDPDVTDGPLVVGRLLPPAGLRLGAVHEVLADTAHGIGLSFALMLAASAAGDQARVVWCDPRRELYPRGLPGLGLDRLTMIRTRAQDEVWAIGECLRCKGVAAVVGAPLHLTRVQTRRLQLAAEQGGGVGVLLRPMSARAGPYAAATRWRVEPATGDEAVRRFRVELIHGRGGRVGESVLLEVCRETNHVRATDRLADRSIQAASAAGA